MPTSNASSDHDRFLGVIEPVRAGLLGLIGHVEGLRSESTGVVELGGEAPAHFDDDLDRDLGLALPPARTARQHGNLLLHAAGEHLAAMSRLLEMQETVVFSDKVLLRAGIEASARAVWLLDPSIRPIKRAARGLTEQVHSHREATGLQPAEKRAAYVERRDRWIKDSAAAGIHLVKRPNAEQAMVALFGDGPDNMALGRSAQELLSLFVHSTPSGLLSMTDRALMKRGDDQDVYVPLVSDAKTVGAMIGIGTLAYAIAGDAFLKVFGRWSDAWGKDVMNNMRLLDPFLSAA